MMSDSGKLWVKGHKARQEMGAQAEKIIMIMDLDQGFQWTLMPDVKMFGRVCISLFPHLI
jgi:hypothetical protein